VPWKAFHLSSCVSSFFSSCGLGTGLAAAPGCWFCIATAEQRCTTQHHNFFTSCQMLQRVPGMNVAPNHSRTSPANTRQRHPYLHWQGPNTTFKQLSSAASQGKPHAAHGAHPCMTAQQYLLKLGCQAVLEHELSSLARRRSCASSTFQWACMCWRCSVLQPFPSAHSR
jgi:hypothetical protein